MKIIKPDYYDSFTCLAGACPDSCCKDWAVDVDPDSARRYLALEGPLGDALRAVLVEENGEYSMEIINGRCPMWREDGLCNIQAQLGHNGLCEVCKTFPRLRHDYGDFVELGLELSCPQAAELIFSSAGTFLSQVTDEGSSVEYDEEIMAILQKSRETFLSFLEETNCSLPKILTILLLYGYDVQGEIDGGEEIPFDPEDCLKRAAHYAGQGDLEAVFDFFRELNILTLQWKDRLNTPAENPAWQDTFKPLIRYFICRYWLQVVSDFDLVCRVKFIIIACILISALDGDPVQTAQLFSKEIENDADNVEAIFDGAYTAPAFTDANLLGLLLNS